MQVEIDKDDLDNILKHLEDTCPVWRCSFGTVYLANKEQRTCLKCQGTGVFPTDAGMRLLAFLHKYTAPDYADLLARHQLYFDPEGWTWP